jgi:hypothetical protein
MLAIKGLGGATDENALKPVNAKSPCIPCVPLHYERHCAILCATTNPHDRRGLTIWLEGEKAGASRFFRVWSTEMQGTESGNEMIADR